MIFSEHENAPVDVLTGGVLDHKHIEGKTKRTDESLTSQDTRSPEVAREHEKAPVDVLTGGVLHHHRVEGKTTSTNERFTPQIARSPEVTRKQENAPVESTITITSKERRRA